MWNPVQGVPTKRTNHFWKGLLAGAFIAVALLAGGLLMLRNTSEPREAPEAERVLSAQAGLPFQVLIPAYLPAGFMRERMEIKTDQPGPHGEPMVQLIYSTRQGSALALSEWIPSDQGADQAESNARLCRCICRSPTVCDVIGAEFSVGLVRVSVQLSAVNLLSHDQLQFVLDTLGPAANRQVYTAMEQVPLTYSVSPAVDIPLNADGVQEFTLVVTPQGYSPEHFAVKKDVPVRLIFRQLGQVGCGNELIVEWGAGKRATLTLASPSDKQILEFTPEQAGDSSFHCPHQIYRGVMTVRD